MTMITPRIRCAAPSPSPTFTLAPIPVELHIDALVMHGFSRSDAQRAAGSLQRELTRLLGNGGLTAGSFASARRLDAGRIAIVAGWPELTGIRAAAAIHAGLRP